MGEETYGALLVAAAMWQRLLLCGDRQTN